MKIKSAKIIMSAASPAQFPQSGVHEIAFAGKSNVGKSTLINSLLNRKNLVKTSGTPGKTQLINFFLINDAFTLVDLPGYGFAQVPKSVQQNWRYLLETYLSSREQLRGVVLIIDIRHGPNQADLQLKEWLEHYHRSILVIANKADKLSRNQQKQQIYAIQKEMGLDTPPIAHSSIERIGKNEIWSALHPWLGFNH